MDDGAESPVADRSERASAQTSIPARRHGIAVRLAVGILGITALTVVTIGLALVGLRGVSDSLETVNRETLPAVETTSEINRIVRSIDSEIAALPTLDSPFAIDASSFRLRALVDALDDTVATMDNAVVPPDDIADIRRSIDIVRRLMFGISTRIQQQLELDWRHQRNATELAELGQVVEESRLRAIARGQRVEEIAGVLRRGVNLALAAHSTNRPDRVIALRDRFEATREALFWRLAANDVAVVGAFPGQVERLRELAHVFDDRLLQLENAFRTRSLIRRMAVMDRLIGRVEAVADRLTAEARTRAANIENTVDDLTLTLIAVAVFGLALSGALLAYSKSRIVDRMRGLQKSMLLHVAGTPRPVDVSGTDEIADIARSFVHFVDEVDTREQRLQKRTRELDAAATALTEKETQLRTALESMSDGLFMVDTDGRYELFNPQYVNFLGHFGVPDAMIGTGRPLYDVLLTAARAGLYGKGDPEALARSRLSVFQHGDVSVVEVVTPSAHWFELRKAPRAEGGSVTTLTEITERKRVQRALSDALEQLSDSINYASFIQRALLPPDRYLADDLSAFFVLWQPRDVVGGDIYWYRRCRGGFLLIVADCTGHGVPGAFMTIVATGTLDRALREQPDGDPATIVRHMNRSVKISLRQDEAEGESDDGLELGVCRIEPEARRLTFAGARFALFHAGRGGLHEIKGDRSSIGYRAIPIDRVFTNREITFDEGDAFYMTTDGLTDQIGGPKRRAFGKRRFAERIAAVTHRPMAEQKTAIVEALADYQGEESRRDDVTVLGFRP